MKVERVSPPLVGQKLKDAFYGHAAQEVQSRLGLLKLVHGEALPEATQEAVYTATAFGNGLLVNARALPAKALPKVEDAFRGAVENAESLFGAGEKLEGPMVRGTVAQAVEETMAEQFQRLLVLARAETLFG